MSKSSSSTRVLEELTERACSYIIILRGTRVFVKSLTTWTHTLGWCVHAVYNREVAFVTMLMVTFRKEARTCCIVLVM